MASLIKNLEKPTIARTWFCGMITLTMILVGSGCQSVFKSPGSASVPPGPGNSPDSQSYSVEVHSNWSNPTTTRESFAGPVPLQKIVEKSGSARRYRGLEVTVVRVSKDTGQLVRMKAKYDPQRRAIEPQYDYDILANDHVIIKPDNSSPLDDIVKPLNKIVGG
jgi:hypothetical protein